MIELIDVSKWFKTSAKINVELISAVWLEDDYFCIYMMGDCSQRLASKNYSDKKTAEYEMEQFCKKISGEI